MTKQISIQIKQNDPGDCTVKVSNQTGKICFNGTLEQLVQKLTATENNQQLKNDIIAVKSIIEEVIPELEDSAEYSRNELRKALLIFNKI